MATAAAYASLDGTQKTFMAQASAAKPMQNLTTEASVKVDMTRELAEVTLRENGLRDGDYVIRRSVSHEGDFVLCVAARNAVFHYPVSRIGQGKMTVLSPGERRAFDSLDDVLQFYKRAANGLASVLTMRLA